MVDPNDAPEGFVAVVHGGCNGCHFYNGLNGRNADCPQHSCSGYGRRDYQSVIFIKKEPTVTAHPHAENMMLYAQDALETDKPWLRWQIKGPDSDQWREPVGPMSFVARLNYRRKPVTININGYEVPEPLRVAPEDGAQVWFPATGVTEACAQTSAWYASVAWLQRLFERGLLHDNEEAAQLHLDALLSFTRKDVEK